MDGKAWWNTLSFYDIIKSTLGNCNKRGEKMYNIAICDDSKQYITYIKKVMDEARENMDMELRVYEFSSGEELVRNLENDIIYDLLILDMCLGGMDGNETARIFRKKFPYAVLVFCSGQLKPTIESFLATPFRYLMKQQNSSQLLETMKEILNEVKKNSADPFLMAHYRQTMQKVKIRNILYIEADFEEKLLINQKPKQLLEKLKPYGFAMAQSTCLVNMNHIEVLHTTDFKFDTGEIMKISRACQNEFRNNANRYLSSKYL